MGISAWIVLAALEIALAVRTCHKKPEKKEWRRERLMIRAAEAGIVVLHFLCSTQKWRFAPALGFVALLFVGSALTILIRRNKEDGKRKCYGIVLSCVLCILAFGLFLIPAFLFTDYNGLPVSGEHTVGEASAILIDSSRTDPFEQDGSFREIPVHFYFPADGVEGKCPLIIFSHGAFGYYQSNTSTYMELASNGYVVVALDHPHHAFFTQDTEGKIVIVDRDFINTAMKLNDVTDTQDRYELFQRWMALRTGDMGFVMDELKEAALTGAADGDWYFSDSEGEAIQAPLRLIDVSRIGLMGHSMGGATSVALGRTRDDVSAVIDLDGTMLGEYLGVENGEFLINETPFTVPVLEFNNWESYIEREEYLAQGGRYPNDLLIRNAPEGFSTTIRDTKHIDFTDLPMFSPMLGKMLGSGERSTEETMTIVNSLALSFFDCYLKGEGVFTVQGIY